jgi:Zn-dependent protease with chaperone function
VPANTRSHTRRDRHGGFDRVRKTEEAQQASYELTLAVRQAADARKDAEWRATADSNRRRVVTLLALPLVPAVVFVLCGIVLQVLLIVGVVLVVAVVGMAVATWTTMAGSAANAIGGLEPQEAVARGVIGVVAAERFVDLAEQVCTTLGLPAPRLRVIDDQAPNAVSVGRSPEDATVFMTAGLLESLERIELEAVIAHEMVHVKRLDIAAVALELSAVGTTLLTVFGHRSALWLEGRDRECEADLAAVAVTRYPPGLLTTLERIMAAGDVVPKAVPAGVLSRTQRAWLAPLAPGEPGSSVADRADVLREL